MRYLWKSAVIVVTLLILTGLLWSRDNHVTREHAPWKNGYWVWAGEPPLASKTVPDILYVQVQGDRWPTRLPQARQFMVVRRLEPTSDLALLVPELAASYIRIKDSAGSLPLAGLQLDYDSPTAKLPQYAGFLRELRKAIPEGTQLSITALLDWFRPGTSIQEVVEQVDEFVPQFYDAGPRRLSAGIAEPIDAAKWAPVFNALGVPYRIGISSFGRIARRRGDPGSLESVMYFRDAAPLEFAVRPDLVRSTSTTGSGEVVAQYVIQSGDSLHSELERGDTVDITFPTEQSVRDAVEAVRQFGEYCSGLILFRWPNEHETLALTPEEVSLILEGRRLPAEPEMEARDGGCAARACTDLYLTLTRQQEEQEIWIQSREPLDLFLAGGPLHPRVDRFNRIAVHVPPYSGLHRVYLGRAFAQVPMTFEVWRP